MPQLPAGRPASSSGAPRTTHQPLGVGLLGRVQQRGLGLRVDARARRARMTSALRTPWRIREHRGEVEPEALAEASPLPLDHGARVDERAVEVEEQRRQTRILAASRATP